MSNEQEYIEQVYLESISNRIRDEANRSDIDIKQMVSDAIVQHTPYITTPHISRYARNKYAIAKVLQPKRIFEVGIGWGIAARAFTQAIPDVDYFGIDSESMGVPIAEALDGLPNCKSMQIDSDELSAFKHPSGSIDLIHIDGLHTREHAGRDIVKAIRSGATWIAIDDVIDHRILAAMGDAFHDAWTVRQIPMIFFERSHSGTMLVHNI